MDSVNRKWERRGFGGQTLGVLLQSESQAFSREGEWIAMGGGHLLTDVLSRALDDSFVFLQYLNEYGDTVFNTLQMEAVIPELIRLMPYTHTAEERATLEDVIAMANRVREGTHLYLIFLGD